MAQMTPDIFFDFSQFQWNNIFSDITNVWEALPKIIPFITSQFSNGIITANYQDRNDVFIGEGTVIQPGVHIPGPAIIGKNCILGHASLYREGVIIGDNTHIGHAVEVKHSIILNNAAAAHLNYIGDSIIGNNVNISGGTILANFRLDKKPILIKTKEKIYNTELRKFGAIIGDNSNVGVNSVLNPGTILGKNCLVYPLQSARGYYENNEIIK
jgi:UDP-N-acetylglucosamine diphosphorylase / glucose-1-phosphate thymidylyltransferase / UDP-N-acetylgalactosamine diphosphorylase / glucosamine-1-phosphate N-acetyltransferase / galactosamine-1-phosphate N-acetyltransferase